jgi:hypothetical protein
VADILRRYAETCEWIPLLTFAPWMVVLGAVHALTPGHNKTLLAIYMTGDRADMRLALRSAFLQSLIHISRSLALVLLALPLVSLARDEMGRAPLMEPISNGLLAGVGLGLVWSAVRGTDTDHAKSGSTGFAVSAGLIPCPLTVFLMTFAVARGGDTDRRCHGRHDADRRCDHIERGPSFGSGSTVGLWQCARPMGRADQSGGTADVGADRGGIDTVHGYCAWWAEVGNTATYALARTMSAPVKVLRFFWLGARCICFGGIWGKPWRAPIHSPVRTAKPGPAIGLPGRRPNMSVPKTTGFCRHAPLKTAITNRPSYISTPSEISSASSSSIPK